MKETHRINKYWKTSPHFFFLSVYLRFMLQSGRKETGACLIASTRWIGSFESDAHRARGARTATCRARPRLQTEATCFKPCSSARSAERPRSPCGEVYGDHTTCARVRFWTAAAVLPTGLFCRWRHPEVLPHLAHFFNLNTVCRTERSYVCFMIFAASSTDVG